MGEGKSCISLIVAMAKNGVIGRHNQLPWRLPADLAHFKALTMGKPMVMGRKTWESLPGLLSGRQHIVVTRDESYRAEGCTLVHSLDEALKVTAGEPEVMIVGGGALYQAMMPRADRLYLTLVEVEVEGDTHFPRIDWQAWREVSRQHHAADERNPHACTFVQLERIRS